MTLTPENLEKMKNRLDRGVLPAEFTDQNQMNIEALVRNDLLEAKAKDRDSLLLGTVRNDLGRTVLVNTKAPQVEFIYFIFSLSL